MQEKDFNEVFSKRLRYFLYRYDMTQIELANRLNVSATSVYNWYNGIKVPRMSKIDAMCEIFNCKRSDLIEEKAEQFIPHTCSGVSINVFDKVAAGIPISAIEDIIDTEELTPEMAATGKFFGLQIKGDSMLPTICSGDTVIVRQQDDAESGDIVIATINGDEATCRRLRKYRDGLELIANNPSYVPMEFTDQEIEEKPVRILGKVVELRRKL